MYAGKLVESAPVEALYSSPKHPYAQGLLDSVRLRADRNAPLQGIPGAVPNLLQVPAGCSFHPRCSVSDLSCRSQFPPMLPLAGDRSCACYKVQA
jgi:oligopeptide/dipeptide ABC transporter ATP-binding protein